MESARRVALSIVVLTILAGCGSSHPAAYSGRLYSVAQVKRAFAQLGVELHQDANQVPGRVVLVNDLRLGPQHLPASPREVTVIVLTSRTASSSAPSLSGQVTRFANVTTFAKRYAGDETRAAISVLRWGTFGQMKPGRERIVLGSSIGAVWLGEPRKRVERELGKGVRRGGAATWYPRKHLLLSYAPHGTIVPWVGAIITAWSGFRGPAGVRVGTTRKELSPLYVGCAAQECSLQAGAMPDAPGTIFTLRRGKVVQIDVFSG